MMENMRQKIENNVFYVVSLGDEKIIEQNRENAIKTLVEMVNEIPDTDFLETLNPEIIGVDVSGEKWNLKGIPWNIIALELMRKKK